MGEHALAWDCRPRGDSETSVAFLEVAAVERLRDLVCLATGVFTGKKFKKEKIQRKYIFFTYYRKLC